MSPPHCVPASGDPLAPEDQVVPRVEIVVPARNEERDLGPGIRRLVTYLRTSFPFSAPVCIADNGSTDRTWAIATDLAWALGEVRAVRMDQPGRGRRCAPSGARELPQQMVTFVAIGVPSTLAYLLLYLTLRTALPAQAANAVSLLLTAIGNTAANRRFTFGIQGRAGSARHQFQGLLAFGAGLLLTSGALAGLHALSAHPSRAAEILVLLAANLAATAVRFLLYRSWVFRPRPAPRARPAHAATRRAARPASTPLASPRLASPTQPEGSDR
jgi:putative flippase GtrA